MGLWSSGVALGAGPGVVGRSIHLAALSDQCTDQRFPTLAGPWVVGCDDAGTVDRVLSLQTGALMYLPERLEEPGIGATLQPAEGYLYQAGRRGGLLRLSAEGIEQIEGITRVHQRLVSRPVTDGQHLALLSEGKLQAFEATRRGRSMYDAQPMGWYPPALAWPWVAWVQDGGGDGEDVWWMDARGNTGGTPLSAGPGHQRHVVGSGSWLAWVEDDAVVILDTRDGTREHWPDQTGFSAPLGMWAGVVCWESRASGIDVDIVCSDGVELSEPGHQRWPARWDRWLLYRQDGRVMLYTAP